MDGSRATSYRAFFFLLRVQEMGTAPHDDGMTTVEGVAGAPETLPAWLTEAFIFHG